MDQTLFWVMQGTPTIPSMARRNPEIASLGKHEKPFIVGIYRGIESFHRFLVQDFVHPQYAPNIPPKTSQCHSSICFRDSPRDEATELKSEPIAK